MSYATRALRREVEQTEHPIGLGWLLAIALCGGILLFTTVGLLLVWWVKKNRHPGPQMVYGYSATRNSLLPPSSSRLIKRRLLGSESFSKVSSRFSSRFSFSGGAQHVVVQTPLPTYEGVQLPERRRTVSRGRKRSRSWVDEDDLHGPKMVRNNKRSARESWFGRDGRLVMAPTLPNVGMIVPESEKGYVQVGGEPPMAQAPQPRWLPRSQTEPRLATIPGSPLSPRGDKTSSVEAVSMPLGGIMAPIPQSAHVRSALIRSSKTDPSLKAILRSTDMRLSQRSSRSPVKASRLSALKVSPTKSSCSSRTGVSRKSGRDWRVSGSPPKRGGSLAGSRNNSVSSIGSAANSLILAATQELELPDGSSSPSKARSVHWERQDQQMVNRSPERAQYTASLSQSPQRLSPQRQSSQRHGPQRQNSQTQSTQRQSQQRHSPQRQNPQMVMLVPHVQMQAPQMKFPQMHHPQLVFPQMQQSSISHVQQQSSKKNTEHRMSVDSDKSSSLSTLYSTNEPEEERPRQQQQQQQTQDDDPFVEKGGPRRWPSWQARQRPANMDPSQRRAKTLSVSLAMGEPSCPPPMRPISAISQPDMGCEGLTPLILEPRARATNRCSISQMPYLLEAPSEASFASVSVDSDATEVPATEMQRVDWVDSSDSSSSSPTTPTRQTRFRDMSSSSPYDEREMMSLLMGTAPAHRTLPLHPSPSMLGPDGSIITVLSPPPRGGGGGGLVRQASTSSSIYTLESFIGEGAAISTSPSRRSAMRSLVEGQRLSNTVAELRRMNSMISTYSVASLASTAAGEGDSPTLPSSLSGSGHGVTASRSIRFGTASIGSRHYLNIGSNDRRSLIVTGSRYGPRRAQHRRAETYHYGKENLGLGLGLGLRLSCIMDETINVVTQTMDTQEEEDEEDTQDDDDDVNLVCEPAMQIIEGIPSGVLCQKLTPVEQLIAAEQRQNLQRASIDSLGLYDNDGFLLSSPERDAKRRGVRV